MATPPPTERRPDDPLSGPVDFATAWPEVRRSLLASLARRVDAATAEDICQDVAERVLRADLVFEEVDGLRRWARRVARSRLIDDWRTRSRYLSPDPLPDSEAPFDLTTVVAYRLALRETAAALGTVRPHEWAALFSEANHPDKRSRDRESLRRFRARERLRRAVRNFPVAVGLRLRWFQRHHVALADLGNVVVGAAVSAVLLVAAPLVAPPDALQQASTALASSRPSALPRSEAASSAVSVQPAPGGTRAVANRSGVPPRAQADWSTVAVEHPTGAAKVGFVDNEPEKPLVCGGTEATGSVCVPQVDVPDPLPLSLP